MYNVLHYFQIKVVSIKYVCIALILLQLYGAVYIHNTYKSFSHICFELKTRTNVVQKNVSKGCNNLGQKVLK